MPARASRVHSCGGDSMSKGMAMNGDGLRGGTEFGIPLGDQPL